MADLLGGLAFQVPQCTGSWCCSIYDTSCAVCPPPAPGSPPSPTAPSPPTASTRGVSFYSTYPGLTNVGSMGTGRRRLESPFCLINGSPVYSNEFPYPLMDTPMAGQCSYCNTSLFPVGDPGFAGTIGNLPGDPCGFQIGQYLDAPCVPKEWLVPSGTPTARVDLGRTFTKSYRTSATYPLSGLFLPPRDVNHLSAALFPVPPSWRIADNVAVVDLGSGPITQSSKCVSVDTQNFGPDPRFSPAVALPFGPPLPIGPTGLCVGGSSFCLRFNHGRNQPAPPAPYYSPGDGYKNLDSNYPGFTGAGAGRRLSQTDVGKTNGCESLVVSRFTNNGNPYDQNGNIVLETLNGQNWVRFDSTEQYSWSIIPNDHFAFYLLETRGCQDCKVATGPWDPKRCFCSYGGVRLMGPLDFVPFQNNDFKTGFPRVLEPVQNVYMNHQCDSCEPAGVDSSTINFNLGQSCSGTAGTQGLGSFFNGQRNPRGMATPQSPIFGCDGIHGFSSPCSAGSNPYQCAKCPIGCETPQSGVSVPRWGVERFQQNPNFVYFSCVVSPPTEYVPFQSWRFQYAFNTSFIYIFYAQLEPTQKWLCLQAPPIGQMSNLPQGVWSAVFMNTDQSMTGCTQWRLCDITGNPSECASWPGTPSVALPPIEYIPACILENADVCDSRISGRLEVPLETSTPEFCTPTTCRVAGFPYVGCLPDCSL